MSKNENESHDSRTIDERESDSFESVETLIFC